MYLLFFLICTEILANSHIDSAERKTTYIKSQAEQLSKIARDFYKKPNAPILFYNHRLLRKEALELEKEFHKINDSN